MAYKRKKKKKLLKPRKYSVKISRKQYELLKLHCAYTQQKPGKVLKSAISLYLKQVSHDINHWKKITPGKSFLSDEEKANQMEIKF